MLYGSFLPLSVTPGTFTFRFVRYFSSILYGWRAPDVKSNVILTIEEPGSEAIEGCGMVSDDGPIATESLRDIVGCGAGDIPAAEDVEVVVGILVGDLDNGPRVASDVATAADSVEVTGLVFSPAMSEVDGKPDDMGEVAGIETSLRRPDDPAPVLVLSSVISTGSVDCAGPELDC